MNDNAVPSILERLKEQLLPSKRSVVFLPPNSEKASIVRSRWNLAESSLLGAIIYGTGGIVIDGWVRLLASGIRDIVSWNDLLNIRGHVVIADDVVGGLFGIKENSDRIHYFAPDTLEWEEMEFTYPRFVRWLVEGDTDTFYKTFRWQGWEQEVVELDFSEGISFYPFLWAQAERRFRKPVPLREIITLAFDMREQLGEA